jgi:hypothetical protein
MPGEKILSGGAPGLDEDVKWLRKQPGCKMEVPMLDEEEYKLVTSRHGTKAGDSKEEIRERFFGPLPREYERVTGFRETNPNAGYHHRLSLYGPPCTVCQKPLRTPKAKFCAACGHPRASASE